MLLTDLNSNELYNEIKSLVIYLIEDKKEIIDIDNLQVYITDNTYYKSTAERIVSNRYLDEDVLNDLEISQDQMNNSINENIIKVINFNTTLDVNLTSFMNSSKRAVFLTIYKIEE